MRYYKNSKTNLIWVVPFIAIFIAYIAQPALAVSAGSLVAWGNNNIGQCDVPAGSNFTAISANGRNYLSWSWQHSVALKSDGSLVAWGTSDSNVPAGNFTAIATGFYHSLALKSDGSLVAWGQNADGQCNVPAGNNFTAIAAGAYHNFALKSDGSLVAWGYNGDGQCNVPAGNDFTAIAAGAYHSLALKSDGSLVAWGKNDDGQCNVPAGNDFIAIGAGDLHSLALKSDGSLVAWGDNSYGQCAVPTGNDFTAISAGGYHNLALKSDGSLAADGNNVYGQCDVPAGNNFIAIAAGGFHNLALTDSPVYSPLVATPTIYPDGGTFTGLAQIALSCSTSGATIRYTVDGNDPISSSALYSGPFTISNSCTVNAKGFKSSDNSNVASAAFTISPAYWDNNGGDIAFDFADVLDIWDISGSYSGEVADNINLSYTITQDTRGKIAGTGTANVCIDGNNCVDIPCTVKGYVKQKNGIAYVRLTISGKGILTIAGVVRKVSFSEQLSVGTINPSDGKISGSAKVRVSVSGRKSQGLIVPFTATLAQNMDGLAVLYVHCSSSGNYLLGTANLMLPNGQNYGFSVKGKYNVKLNESNLNLKGNAPGNSLKIKIDSNGYITALKGNVLGQVLRADEITH